MSTIYENAVLPVCIAATIVLCVCFMARCQAEQSKAGEVTAQEAIRNGLEQGEYGRWVNRHAPLVPAGTEGK